MRKVSTVAVGGGASGILAAISAARKGHSVMICERMASLGRKILASGNGRCNLLNENLNESFYNPSARHLVKAIFAKVGKDEILKFFRELGLETCVVEGGRIFPVTNQSASVLKVLEMELARLRVVVDLNFDVKDIIKKPGSFTVTSRSGSEISCESVVLTGGGMTTPALGSNGSAYDIAGSFGHTIVKPVPAAVPIVVKDRLCHALQGQKIAAKVRLFINGRATAAASGDLLFTKYGLSGTAILDISAEASVAINRLGAEDVAVSVDMVPFISEKDLAVELDRRSDRKFSPEDLLVGLLPNKFIHALKGLLKPDTAGKAALLKNMRFKITGTRGWNEADFTAGGVSVGEVDAGTLESKLQKRLYLSGEVLDVCGRRGGYNLAWAWASGLVAGRNVEK